MIRFVVHKQLDAGPFVRRMWPDALQIDDEFHPPFSHYLAQVMADIGITANEHMWDFKGDGAHRLARIIGARHRDPDHLLLVNCPERSLHPGVLPNLASWMTGHGHWILPTFSPHMVEGAMRLSQRLEIYFWGAEGTAIESLRSAVKDEQPHALITVENGSVSAPFPEGFIDVEVF